MVKILEGCSNSLKFIKRQNKKCRLTGGCLKIQEAIESRRHVKVLSFQPRFNGIVTYIGDVVCCCWTRQEKCYIGRNSKYLYVRHSFELQTGQRP